jgi:putative ABC transport system permease protein
VATAERVGRVRLSSALTLYRVRLRRRWVQELLAILGIAAGVALLYATQVASTSLSGPVRSINDGLVGHSQLQLLARGGAGVPEQTYDAVVRLPGVRRAAPILQLPGNLVGPKGQRGVTLFGADPRIVQLRGNLLKGFSSQDAAEQETVVIPTPTARAIGVGVGDDVRVQLAGRTVTVPAVVADHDQIGALVHTSLALAPLTYVQRLARMPRQVTRILVEAEPGKVDEVRRGLQGLTGGERMDVRPADYETRLFDQAASPTSQASTIFSIISALVGWLFAVCALLVTAAERRKLAVQQREQGFTPAATVVTLLVDAAVVGLVGAVLGLAAGELLSREGFSSDVTFLSGAFPIGDQRVVTWPSVAIAVAGGLLAAAVGVLAPVRDVVFASLPRWLRRRPDAGAAPSRHVPRLPILGLVCLAVAGVVAAAAPGAAAVGMIMVGIALMLLLPVTLTWVIAGLERANRRERSVVSIVLALQQLHESRWRPRALAITATGAVAVFGATALQGARQNLQAGLDGLATGLTSVSDVWAAPAGAGSAIGTATFSPTAATRLNGLPGVRGVALYRAGLLDVADRRAWVLGEPRDVRAPIPAGQVLEGDAALAARRVRAGGWATVSQALADDLGYKVGRRFTLPSPEPVTLRVAAITTNLGWSGGALVMNADELRRAWGSDAVAAYHVRLGPGADVRDVEREVTTALGPGSALRVESAGRRAARQREVARDGLSRLEQIAALTLIAAVLAMSAAMIGLLWQHRPSVVERKQHGLSTGLLWRSLIMETVVLFGTGAVAGGIFGLLGQVLCTRGLQAVTGFPVAHELRVGIALWVTAVVIGASSLIVIVPGYLVARARPSWRE